MLPKIKQDGFSAAEVLIAVGILGVAMIFVAGIFPVGLRFAQISTDRTNAAIAANEAFAKIMLYSNRTEADGIGPRFDFLSFTESRDFNDWLDEMDSSNNYFVDVNTFSYPTDNAINFDDKHYCWSALLRRTDRFQPDLNKPDSSHDVQVTVFVCLRQSPTVKYYQPDVNAIFGGNNYGRRTNEKGRLPKPVRVEIEDVPGRDNELRIKNTNPGNNNEHLLINDGDVIVDDPTGRIYRVMERYAAPDDNTILLDKDWIDSGSGFIWVVPPPAAPGAASGFSGRKPCVAVYQKVIRF